MKKNLIATIYLKNGKLVSGFNDYTEQDDLMERIRLYNDTVSTKFIFLTFPTTMQNMN